MGQEQCHLLRASFANSCKHLNKQLHYHDVAHLQGLRLCNESVYNCWLCECTGVTEVVHIPCSHPVDKQEVAAVLVLRRQKGGRAQPGNPYLRSTRRMILPLRVLGMAAVN